MRPQPRVLQIFVAGLLAAWFDAANAEPNGESLYPPLTYDGKVVAFASKASNLVDGDENGASDVFVMRIGAAKPRLISVNDAGKQGDRDSTWPSLAGKGRFVVFTSDAANLVAKDANGVKDVFLHDLVTRRTQRISVNSDGDEADHDSYNYFPAISADGRFVVFASQASNLVPGDGNGTWDIFLRDLITLKTFRVSESTTGTEGNGPSLHASISGDGRFVVFHSLASSLVENDKNGTWDVFLRDLTSGELTRVSVAADGIEGNGASDRAGISHDGRIVVFSSMADNLVPNDKNNAQDVFIYDRESKEVTMVGGGSDEEPAPTAPGVLADRKAIASPSGQVLVYRSDSGGLVEQDMNGVQDVFVYDRTTKQTSRVSVASNKAEGNGASVHHGTSFDGRLISFSSEASNLVEGDTNGVSDIFLHDRQTGQTIRVTK